MPVVPLGGPLGAHDHPCAVTVAPRTRWPSPSVTATWSRERASPAGARGVAARRAEHERRSLARRDRDEVGADVDGARERLPARLPVDAGHHGEPRRSAAVHADAEDLDVRARVGARHLRVVDEPGRVGRPCGTGESELTNGRSETTTRASDPSGRTVSISRPSPFTKAIRCPSGNMREFRRTRRRSRRSRPPPSSRPGAIRAAARRPGTRSASRPATTTDARVAVAAQGAQVLAVGVDHVDGHSSVRAAR